MVTLRPRRRLQSRAILALRVSPAQLAFVSSVEDSLLEAEEEPGGRAIQWGLYDDETPVGFVMVSDEVDGPGYIPQYLWKLLVDERHQRKRLRDGGARPRRRRTSAERPGVEVMWTSAGQGDGSPIPFYERYGFERTGEIVFDDEVLLRLRL